MRRSPREQRIYLLSIPFALAPFALAFVYAFRSNFDLRYLWLAFASFLGAALTMAIGQARHRAPSVVIRLSVLAWAVGVLLAISTASLLWTSVSPTLWAVALLFGLSWAISHALDTLSRPRDT